MKRTEKICRADKGKGCTSDIKKQQRRAERREHNRQLKLLGAEAENTLKRRYFGWTT